MSYEKPDAVFNQEYVRETINMTGKEYIACNFFECTLVDNGIPTSALRSPSDGGGNSFRLCEFIGDGWPEGVKNSKAWRPK